MFWTILFLLSAVCCVVAYVQIPMVRFAVSIGWLLTKKAAPHLFSCKKAKKAEASFVGRCIKIPFLLEGKEYNVYLPFNEAAKKDHAGIEVQMLKDEVVSNMGQCPGIAVYVTPKDLQAEKVFVSVGGDASEFADDAAVMLP